MSQLAIEFHARRTDPSTSHKAAATVGKFAGEHHALILEALRCHGAMTIYGIAGRTHLDHVAVARRMKELEGTHQVIVVGEKRGPSGRMCRVWHLKARNE